MTDSRIHKAKAASRQDQQREVDVWRDREAAGRAARQTEPPRGTQSVASPDSSSAAKASARVRQAPDA